MHSQTTTGRRAARVPLLLLALALGGLGPSFLTGCAGLGDLLPGIFDPNNHPDPNAPGDPNAPDDPNDEGPVLDPNEGATQGVVSGVLCDRLVGLRAPSNSDVLIFSAVTSDFSRWRTNDAVFLSADRLAVRNVTRNLTVDVEELGAPVGRSEFVGTAINTSSFFLSNGTSWQVDAEGALVVQGWQAADEILIVSFEGGGEQRILINALRCDAVLALPL